MKNKLFELGRRGWQRYGKYVPDPARDEILKLRNRYRDYATSRSGEMDGAGMEQGGLDTQLQEILADAKKRGDQHGNDGMRDYPVTRPQLAFDYMSGLVRWLAESDYTVMSYNDIAGPVPHGTEVDEFQRWIAGAEKRGEKSILLQYDVDARPDVTHALMKTHIACGVPGNAMIFRKKIFDWKLKRDGVVEFDDDYDLDFETFEEFQKVGGVIGYHCNAFDQAGGDMDRAIEIFHDDIAELRKHIDLKFFSLYGGHVTADGACNARMNVAPYLAGLGLTWVHNGHSLYFHSNWADGSASNPRYRNESSDPLDFILSTKPGERSRLLFHPQYYNDFTNTHFDFPILQDQHWVRETRDIVEAGQFDGTAAWRKRRVKAEASIAAYDSLFDAQGKTERPVFVNGMSRSGTTLLVSMFDAHPKGAMAYESYPRYLYVPSDDGVLTTEEYIFAYQSLMNYPDSVAFQLINRPPLKNLMRFAAVTNWTGMTTQQVGELLRAYLVKHHRVADVHEALKIVAASARFKVRAQNAEFWGTKCQGNFEDYFAQWPEARLIYIMRNGLDILASQKTKGAFNPNSKALGKNWRTQYERFHQFSRDNPQYTTAMVQYEHLVRDPETSTQALCEKIGLPFDRQMIRQHEIKTTLAENPRGQLSADRVQQPIDGSAINRWRSILSKQDVEDFLSGCGGRAMFETHGLDWEF